MNIKQRHTAKLSRRWHEQCEKFPLMRQEIPLALYLKRNVPTSIRNECERATWPNPNGPILIDDNTPIPSHLINR